jgi:hypothetical protein
MSSASLLDFSTWMSQAISIFFLLHKVFLSLHSKFLLLHFFMHSNFFLLPLHHWPANGPICRPKMLAHWHTIDVNISQSACQLLLMVHHWHANGEWLTQLASQLVNW